MKWGAAGVRKNIAEGTAEGEVGSMCWDRAAGGGGSGVRSSCDCWEEGICRCSDEKSVERIGC